MQSTPLFSNKSTKTDDLTDDQIPTTAATENKDSILTVSKRSITEFESSD